MILITGAAVIWMVLILSNSTAHLLLTGAVVSSTPPRCGTVDEITALLLPCSAIRVIIQSLTLFTTTLLLNIYFIIPFAKQHDKSGRAKCKKCKEKIAKDAVRICSVVPESPSNPYEMKQYHHPGCFSLPRKYGTGVHKISASEFVETVLEDASEQQDILPAKAEELAEQIASKAIKAKTSLDGGGGEGGTMTQMQLIKAALEARNDAKPEAEPSPKKKAKTDSNNKEPNGADSRAVDCYAELLQRDKKERTNEKIKDCLKWNRQHVTGNKDVLLHRWIDGHVHGRLLRCPLDGGRLKLNETTGAVSCGGSFDEATMTRLDCAYKKEDAADAPRGEW